MKLSRAEPLAFGAADRPCLGWLHRPAADAPRRTIGLVICKPFGYEAICADRSLRHFAEAAAAIGVPSFRFDYDGTGDSAGGDRDPDRLQAWTDSVHRAIDELRRLTGVERICLLGVRLGATLAALAAGKRTDVAGLLAIVPVITGKAWLRELTALEMAMDLAGPPPGVDVPSGETESVGFVITDETGEALRRVDLRELAHSPAPDVVILDRDDLPRDDRLAGRLAALGARVDHRLAPGYASMMLDPHEAVVPSAMIDVVARWLEEHSTVRVDEPPGSALPVAPVAMKVAAGVEESAVFLDEHRSLFGIVSVPAGAARPTRAIMILNSGAIPHIGPSRLYVDLARRWAARGYLVLRFDQAGIGDSLPFPGEDENVVYSPSAIRGVQAAFDSLASRFGSISVDAVGLCSGAYHAFKGAVSGIPFASIAVINPLVFFWKRGMSLAYPPYHVVQAAASYKRSILQFEKWKKLAAGNVSLAAFVQVMARRTALRVGILGRDIARTVGLHFSNDLGAELQAVADRGVRLRFVFATRDPGEELLRSHSGWVLPRLLQQERLRIRRIEGPNHSFTRVWTRTVLTNVLEAELDVR